MVNAQPVKERFIRNLEVDSAAELILQTLTAYYLFVNYSSEIKFKRKMVHSLELDLI